MPDINNNLILIIFITAMLIQFISQKNIDIY